MTKTFSLRVRLTEVEKNWLDNEAMKRGVTMSEVIQDYGNLVAKTVKN